ncbi:MAG: AAA domain-containing protein [Saprospiraceae bacterium]|nr:AAA domain-containing protein [Saprospiraceae bacterium]
MSLAHAHLTRLVELLRKEKEADLHQFIQSVKQQPLSARVEQGYCWHPVRVMQTGFALGDRAFVVLERTTRLNEPHQIRSGQSINFFTSLPGAEQPDATGVVNYIDRNRMKVVLNSQDVPEWIDQGHLGVDLLFDDRSYMEMEKALRQVMEARGNRLSELRQLLAPRPDAHPDDYLHHLRPTGTPESFTDVVADPALEGLNASQYAAVMAILNNRDVHVVHGPPGTGKTTTLVAAIQLLAKRENTVLVAAPSNTAADLLTERLADAGVSVVRIGNVSRVDESVLSHTLDGILAAHAETRNIKKVRLQAAEYRRQAGKHKRTFTYEDRRERQHLKRQARELEDWANTLEDRLIDEVLNAAQAITCTLVGASHPLLERMRFGTCVIDEAAQALEPACWIPIVRSSRVVLAGDPFQLPPTVKSLDAARAGLSVTLIERAIPLLPDQVSLLHVQYRMNRAIMQFSNQYFYGGALMAHESVVERRLSGVSPDGSVLTVFDPVVFIDTAGAGFEEKTVRIDPNERKGGYSRCNPEEALLLREHLLRLLNEFPQEGIPSIALLSPYREQVNQLETMIREDARLAPLLRHGRQMSDLMPHSHEADGALTVNTIDGFQGQERDVVYISLVRSNPKGEIGFLQDYRRMNVAMTRARKLLVVIGDSATIGNNPFYEAFLKHCEENGRYDTAWAYLR